MRIQFYKELKKIRSHFLFLEESTQTKRKMETTLKGKKKKKKLYVNQNEATK